MHVLPKILFFMVVPSINPEDKVSLKYIIRQFLKCQKIFKGYIFAEISQFTRKYLFFSKGGPFEYFRKYILRQFLKCQKIFKGNTLRIFSRKCYNLRENILWILFDILKIVLLRFWVTGSEQLSGYQPAQNQALLWSFK